MKKLFIQFIVFEAYAIDEHIEYSLLSDDEISVKVVVEINGEILLTTLNRVEKETAKLIKQYSALEVEKDYTMERMNFFEISCSKASLKHEEKVFDEIVLQSDTILEEIFQKIFLYMGDTDYSITLMDKNSREPHYTLINLDD